MKMENVPETSHKESQRGNDVTANRSEEQSQRTPSDVENDLNEQAATNSTTSCYATRSTARKMRREDAPSCPVAASPLASAPAEQEKKDEKVKVQRLQRSAWTNSERDFFFEALNEFGKDFEALTNAVNAKLKRRNYLDSELKSPIQMRQHYHQTFNNISKYIVFSDEIKKTEQELYALINFGEMRRKIRVMKKQHFSKLKDLVYFGQITFRWNRKVIRVKTPPCMALRRLNQFEDSQEHIRLPSTIDILLNPKDTAAFNYVHSLAQNPIVRITVPLHIRLNSVIQAFERKWRTRLDHTKHITLRNLFKKCKPENSDQLTPAKKATSERPRLRLLPREGSKIYKPLLNIAKQVTSIGICLSAFEERMGFKTRSSKLAEERAVKANKRPRGDAGGRSPERKKFKALIKEDQEVVSQDEDALKTDNLDTDGAFEEMALLMKSDDDSNSQPIGTSDLEGNQTGTASDIEIDPTLKDALKSDVAKTTDTPDALTRSTSNINASSASGVKTVAMQPSTCLKAVLTEDVQKRMRKGWTLDEAKDIKTGDLYVALGQNSRLELDYCWCAPKLVKQVDGNVPFDATGRAENELADDLKPVKAVSISSKLKHLIYIASMSIDGRRHCNCDETDNVNTANIRTLAVPRNHLSTEAGGSIPLFKRPLLPPQGRPPVLTIDPLEYFTQRKRVSNVSNVERRILQPGGVREVDLQSCGQRASIEPNLKPVAVRPKKESTPAPKDLDARLNTPASTPRRGSMPSVQKIMPSPRPPKTPVKADTANDNSIMDWADSSSNLSNLWRGNQSSSRWFDDNADISLGSIVRNLDQNASSPRQHILDTSSNLSFLSETSVDYRQKFQDLRAATLGNNVDDDGEVGIDPSTFCPESN